MARKTPLLLILFGGLLIFCVAFWALPLKKVSAQCKNLSSCKNCHEVQAQHPVNTIAPGSAAGPSTWHTDHANFDLCNACHNGAREATDKTQAHAGLVTKLQDMPGN